MTDRQRIFSGIKPTGKLHIGNYLGAIKQWVALAEQQETIFCIVDLHAITLPQPPDQLHQTIRDLAAWYLACGIDPDKSVIFVQSHNPDHANLAWVLNCFTPYGDLTRMTQFKDKSAKAEFVSAGLFDYPVLMAADILLYDTHQVPVGEDQVQHVELCRDLARRMNHRYQQELFVIPQVKLADSGVRIKSLQSPNKKMSKSETDPLGTIDLADPADQIARKIRKAVTDSGSQISYDPEARPAISNLLEIFAGFADSTPQAVAQQYSDSSYKQFKQDLTELLIDKLGTLQTRFARYRDNKVLDQILEKGLEQARQVSAQTLARVYQAVGLG